MGVSVKVPKGNTAAFSSCGSLCCQSTKKEILRPLELSGSTEQQPSECMYVKPTTFSLCFSLRSVYFMESNECPQVKRKVSQLCGLGTQW